MSAVLKNLPSFRPMCMEDLDSVMSVEVAIYPYPWTYGNFRDSLSAGYSCWIYECDGQMVGYAVMMLAASEAHLLNLGIARHWQRKGLGRKLLQYSIKVARDYHADMMFLEVRPSNHAAIGLYQDTGFNEMGIRKNYYPAHNGREDGILMGMSL